MHVFIICRLHKYILKKPLVRIKIPWRWVSGKRFLKGIHIKAGLSVLAVRKRKEFPDKWRRFIQVKDGKRETKQNKTT